MYKLCYRTIGEWPDCIMGALWAVKAERGAAKRRTRGGVTGKVFWRAETREVEMWSTVKFE